MCILIGILYLIYTAIQKFGGSKIFLWFWKKFLMLTKATFTWSVII